MNRVTRDATSCGTRPGGILCDSLRGCYRRLFRATIFTVRDRPPGVPGDNVRRSVRSDRDYKQESTALGEFADGDDHVAVPACLGVLRVVSCVATGDVVKHDRLRCPHDSGSGLSRILPARRRPRASHRDAVFQLRFCDRVSACSSGTLAGSETCCGGTSAQQRPRRGVLCLFEAPDGNAALSAHGVLLATSSL